MRDLEVDCLVELGNGKVLSGLTRRIERKREELAKLQERRAESKTRPGKLMVEIARKKQELAKVEADLTFNKYKQEEMVSYHFSVEGSGKNTNSKKADVETKKLSTVK